MNYTDEEVLEYCDGTMDPQRSEELARALEHDKELAHRVQVMTASHLPYKEAFAQQSIPELPKSLQIDLDTRVQRLHDRSGRHRTEARANRFGWFSGADKPWQFPAAMAASLVVCFALGFSG